MILSYPQTVLCTNARCFFFRKYLKNFLLLFKPPLSYKLLFSPQQPITKYISICISVWFSSHWHKVYTYDGALLPSTPWSLVAGLTEERRFSPGYASPPPLPPHLYSLSPSTSLRVTLQQSRFLFSIAWIFYMFIYYFN